jgi:hypothetical protein
MGDQEFGEGVEDVRWQQLWKIERNQDLNNIPNPDFFCMTSLLKAFLCLLRNKEMPSNNNVTHGPFVS